MGASDTEHIKCLYRMHCNEVYSKIENSFKM